jgi:hypothetical protein
MKTGQPPDRYAGDRPPCWHDGSCPTPIGCYLHGCKRRSAAPSRGDPLGEVDGHLGDSGRSCHTHGGITAGS